MPKVKSVQKTRSNFFLRREISSSEESLPSSVQSEEYAHVPIEAEKINELTEKFDQISNMANMEELTAQVQLLTQQLALISSKQTEQDSEVNQLRVSNQARNHQLHNNDNYTALQALSRIPDPIKGIQNFDGNKRQLNAWLNTAETTLEKFRPLVDNDVYEIYLQAVFNKIEGRAKDIICLAGNPSTFDEVKTILIEALGDRQELSTYKARLWANKQSTDMSIKHYYNKTKEIVQNIKTISKQDPLYNAHWEAILKFIEQDALAAFIAGLKSPYQGYAQASGPKDLEAAYAFLCKFQSTERIAETHKNSHTPKQNNPINQTKKQYKFENTKPDTEPMETKTTRSRLTINNHETEENNPTDSISDSEEETDLDLNFHLVNTEQKTT